MMNSKMSIFSAVAMMVVGLNAVIPAPQAQAGVILVVAAGVGQIVSDGNKESITGGIFGAGMLSCLIGAFAQAAQVGGGFGTGATFITLDADGSLSQGALEQNLSNHFSFIDNPDVIGNLGSTIKTKYSALKKSDGSASVRLTEDEVRSILAPADLTDEQIRVVASDLK